MPVAPLGSCDAPVLGMTTASGSVVDSADPTAEPLGHWAVVAAAVGVGAGVGVAAVDDDVAGLELPQPARPAASASGISIIQRLVLPVTCPALHLRHRASTGLDAGTMTQLRADAHG